MTDPPNLLENSQKIALDPNKRYFILLPTSQALATQLETVVERFNAWLKQEGITGVLVLLDEPERVRVIETDPA
jgi:hypothetical protein